MSSYSVVLKRVSAIKSIHLSCTLLPLHLLYCSFAGAGMASRLGSVNPCNFPTGFLFSFRLLLAATTAVLLGKCGGSHSCPLPVCSRVQAGFLCSMDVRFGDSFLHVLHFMPPHLFAVLLSFSRQQSSRHAHVKTIISTTAAAAAAAAILPSQCQRTGSSRAQVAAVTFAVLSIFGND